MPRSGQDTIPLWSTSPSFTDFESDIAHPDLKDVLHIWTTARPENGLPPKSALDPTRFGANLANSFLYQYVPERRSFLLRLAGDNLVNAHNGRHSPGKFIDELFPEEQVEITKNRWLHCVDEPALMLIRRDQDGLTLVERLVCPLVGGDEIYLFGTSIYQNPQTSSTDPYRVAQPSQFALALPINMI